MSEEHQEDVKETDELVQPQEETRQNEAQEAPEVQQEEPKEGSKEYNFARLREQKEQLERQNREMMEYLQRIEGSLKAKEQPKPEEVDELASIADDDIITAAQARKMAQRMAQDAIRETLAQQEKASLPEKTRQKYQDFDEVLTEENIKEFEKTNPVLADACSRASNPYQAAYEAIKMSPIYQDRVARKQMEKEAKKIDKNASKPVSSNSLGSSASALGNANAYGEMSPEELYKEMRAAASRA